MDSQSDNGRCRAFVVVWTLSVYQHCLIHGDPRREDEEAAPYPLEARLDAQVHFGLEETPPVYWIRDSSLQYRRSIET
jgi:hypothetical protein